MLNGFLASLDGLAELLTLDMAESDVQKQDVKAITSLTLLNLAEAITHLLGHVLVHRKDTLVQVLRIDVLFFLHELLTNISDPLVVIHYALESIRTSTNGYALDLIDLEPDINVLTDPILLLLSLVDVVHALVILHLVING